MPSRKHVVGVVKDNEALDLGSSDKTDASTGSLPCEDCDPSCALGINMYMSTRIFGHLAHLASRS